MIKVGNTKVSMLFDSGIYKGEIVVLCDKLVYPNKISKELKDIIESSIAIVIDKICNTQKSTTPKKAGHNTRLKKERVKNDK